MESHLHRQYRITLWKYKKFRHRLDKRLKNNTLSTLSLKHRNRLLNTIDRLRRRLASLEQVLKLAGAGALTAAALGIASPALGQEPIKSGTEFRVNTYTTGFQYFPSVARHVDGDFVITWQSDGGQDGSGSSIQAQRYNAAGEAQGSEFTVNTFTTSSQRRPSIAMDGNGDFVIAWFGLFGQDASGYGVYAQRYNAAGEAQGTEFQVNTYTTGGQLEPSVAMKADGDFVITWESNGQDGSVYGIYAQRYNAAGEPQGSEFQVNTYTTNGQHDPAIAMDADGDFVIVWRSNGQDGNSNGIYAQRFNAAGEIQGSEFRVNTYTTSTQSEHSIAMNTDGDFVIAWSSYGQDGSNFGVYAQRYNAAGEMQGSEFLVNTITTLHQQLSSIAIDEDGGFVITWQSSAAQDGSGGSIQAKRYDPEGEVLGSEFLVNTYTTNDQVRPSIAMDINGDFVVTWFSSGQDGDGFGVYAQQFSMPIPPPTPIGTEFQVNTYTTGSQSQNFSAMDASGDFVIAWNSYGQDGSSYGIYAQRYNASGIAQGSEFHVNTYTTGSQINPSIGMDADGDFVIVWSGEGQDASSNGVYGQRYNSSGAVLGSEFQVNTYTTGSQSVSTIAMDKNGNFAIAWQSDGQDGDGYGIYAQRYDMAGVAQGSEFKVNTYTTNNQRLPSIAINEDGDFVVAWQSNGQDGSGEGIYAQRYNASGVAQGNEFLVNTHTTNDQSSPAIAMDADGNFVIAWWSQDQDGDAQGIYAQRYNAVGETQGSEFQVNTYTTSSQLAPSIAMDADGDFVIAWQSTGQDGNLTGTFARRYNASGEPQGSEFQVNTYTTSNQLNASISMDADGDFVITWRSTGQDGSGNGIYGQRYQSANPNLPPEIVANNGLTLPEGNGIGLSGSELNTTDSEQGPAEIVYTITQLPVNGQLFDLTAGSTLINLNDAFTQEDINNVLIAYNHDGSETTSDSFSFTVSDGLNTLPEEVFSISITPVNDDPVLQTNAGLLLDNGENSTIGSSLLSVTDVDNVASEIEYEVTALPTNGLLKNNGATLSLNDIFTQQDINDNLVTYEHDGSNTVSDGFNFIVSDGLSSLSEETFHIIVNEPLLDQTINLDPIADKTQGAAPFALTASASSGLPVQFTVISGPATVSGNTITLTGAGKVTVRVSQPGNADYNPAPNVEQTFCSNPAKPTITVQGANAESPTLVSNAASGNQWFKGSNAIAGATNGSLVASEAGIYRVQVTIDGCTSELSSNFALVITGDDPPIESPLLYPNPVSDFVNVKGAFAKVDRLFIIDNSNKVTEPGFDQQSDNIRVPVGNLATGYYILHITEGEEIHRIKFIKK